MPTTQTDRPVAVRLQRVRGWRIPANTRVVSRPSKWSNPFVVDVHGDREMCVRLFRYAMLCAGSWDTSLAPSQQAELADVYRQWRARHLRDPMDEVVELAGQNLACWCKLDVPCHRSVLLELAAAAAGGVDLKQPTGSQTEA